MQRVKEFTIIIRGGHPFSKYDPNSFTKGAVQKSYHSLGGGRGVVFTSGRENWVYLIFNWKTYKNGARMGGGRVREAPN